MNWTWILIGYLYLLGCLGWYCAVLWEIQQRIASHRDPYKHNTALKLMLSWFWPIVVPFILIWWGIEELVKYRPSKNA